jgi:hypothetical protein
LVDAFIPKNAARAFSFQYGGPNPVKAGIRETPPVSGTRLDRASLSSAD